MTHLHVVTAVSVANKVSTDCATDTAARPSIHRQDLVLVLLTLPGLARPSGYRVLRSLLTV